MQKATSPSSGVALGTTARATPALAARAAALRRLVRREARGVAVVGAGPRVGPEREVVDDGGRDERDARRGGREAHSALGEEADDAVGRGEPERAAARQEDRVRPVRRG